MIELGRKAKDVVTDLEGIVIGRCHYMNGCTQYLIKGKLREDGKTPDAWVDSQQVVVTGPGIVGELSEIAERNAAMDTKAPVSIAASAPVVFGPQRITGGPHPDAPPKWPPRNW